MDYPLKMAEQLRPQLQALRKQRGLTQTQLGKMMGVTQARIVEIEAHPGAVSLQQVMQVLSVLGATLMIRTTDADPLSPPQGTGDNHAVHETPKKGSW